MGLKVAVQMDPIGSININADSTFRIMEEAQARGHGLFYYTPDRLAYVEGRVVARGWPVEVRREVGRHFTLGEEREVDLGDWDVVWLRQDPPFDMSYITTTHILGMIHPRTLVVNDPFWVRNHPEKLLVLEFPDLTPPTTVARDLSTLRAFKARYGDVILKPLYGNGGAGVFRLDPNDRNFAALWELFTGMSREPLIVQKFLADVSAGDKRVILVDGEAVGAINRVPQEGETRSNMHAGGRPEKVALTERDREICARIGPLLREKGQVFVGIDVIGGWLTEINVTSPTGLQELERFDGINATARIWEAIEGAAAMSWQLVLLNLYLRAVEKRYMARATDFAHARARLETGAAALPMPPGAAPRAVAVGGVPALRLDGDRVVFWLHGGAYCLGSPRTHIKMVAALAARLGAGAVVPDYRLAPEHPFPAAVADARAAWDGLRAEGVPAGQIVLGGDSAGGGLALGLLHGLIARGEPLPSAVVTFSPWVDLTESGESLRTLARRDVLLPAARFAEIRDRYLAGADPRDPFASPVFGHFAGAPPVMILSSRVEILRDDARMLAARLRADGVAVTHEEWARVPHAWPLFEGRLPEADAALDRTAAFVAAYGDRGD